MVELDIRQINEGEVAAVQSALSPDSLIPLHQKRYEIQDRGEGVYLIAWHERNPVGHLLLRFEGPDKDPSNRYPYPTPYVEGIETQEAYRRQGVATEMIQAAEQLIIKCGKSMAGLTVGSTDNPDARRLYEKLGYKDWGQGEFTISWDYKNKNGSEGKETEVCIYMFKELL